MLADRLFSRVIRKGNLKVVFSNGESRTYGDGQGVPIVARIHDKATERRMALNPKLAFGEAYMDGRLTLDEGTLLQLLCLCLDNLEQADVGPFLRCLEAVQRPLRYLHGHNPIWKSRRNVAHHYDLSDDLYDLFLDEDRQYSCAYFRTADDDLETAQANKKRHLAAKLLLNRPELSVLDIGSGWGGLGLHLAKSAEVKVTGVTLSKEQHQRSRQRAEDSGLSDRVDFRLQDYRTIEERFDRIVSVGMFEHVGPAHYRQYFGKVRDLLTDDGIAVVHSIGGAGPPAGQNAWIRKYIFPGGYTPSLSEVLRAVEREGLWVTDIEVWRLHYAETLKHWHERFMANWDKAKALYDERFCRMWEFYLAGCEASFRAGHQMVFQVQLAKQRDAVPLTRDYIYAPDKPVEARVMQAAE